MSTTVNEDSLYRQSSQFREWTFSRHKLDETRQKANRQATRQVRRLTRKQLNVEAVTVGKDGESVDLDSVIEPLTVDQEQQLVAYYCNLCFTLGKSMKFSTSAMATAVQFVKRFYIYNSTMHYHPKQIALSALFFASKSENLGMVLTDFVAGARMGKAKKVTEESILKSEFVLCQGLRFTFQMIHPHSGLKGHLMLLLTLVDPNPPVQTFNSFSTALRALRYRLLNQPISFPRREGRTNGQASTPLPTPAARTHSSKELQDRIMEMYKRAKLTIDTITPMTDAYFLFTPAQICFAVMLVADEPIGQLYLRAITHELNVQSTPRPINRNATINQVTDKTIETIFSDPPSGFYNTLMPVITDCIGVAQTVPIHSRREDLVKFDMRLFLCLNPDIVAKKAFHTDGNSSSPNGDDTTGIGKSESASPAIGS